MQVIYANFSAPFSCFGSRGNELHLSPSVPMFVSGILTLALTILLEPRETLMVLIVTAFLGIFVPIWKYHLQHYKVRLRGPWDIAHV